MTIEQAYIIKIDFRLGLKNWVEELGIAKQSLKKCISYWDDIKKLTQVRVLVA
jgi:hypothetical protein